MRKQGWRPILQKNRILKNLKACGLTVDDRGDYLRIFQGSVKIIWNLEEGWMTIVYGQAPLRLLKMKNTRKGIRKILAATQVKDRS